LTICKVLKHKSINNLLLNHLLSKQTFNNLDYFIDQLAAQLLSLSVKIWLIHYKTTSISFFGDKHLLNKV